MSKKLIILGLMVINFSIKLNAEGFVPEYNKTATDSGVVYKEVTDTGCIVEITISKDRPDDGHLCPGYCKAKDSDLRENHAEQEGNILTCYCHKRQ